MATKVTPIQFLRSIVFNKRPDPAKLLDGQPAVNLNPSEPGLFFADSTSNTLFKVGPCAVGATAPNTGATGAPGQLGNTLGELWLDTNGDPPLIPGPTLKVWDGANWINCFPMPSIYAAPIISNTAPSLATTATGTMWWDNSTGLLYVLYEDVDTRQWVQVSASTTT